MRIALIQTNPLIGDFHRNLANIVAWIDRAREANCALAIFPELAICGYPPQDLLERPAFLADLQRATNRLVTETHGIGVLCGTILPNPEASGKPLYNSAILLENGKILFTTHKRLLPCYDVFDETRYFEPGRQSVPCTYKGLTLGLTICEDIWNDKDLFARQLYATNPVTDLLENTAARPELLINLAASPYHLGKARRKNAIFSHLCTKHNVPLLYVNQTGGQDALLFDGRSLAMDRAGRIVAQAAACREDMVVVDSAALLAGSAAPFADPAADETDTVLGALTMGIRDYVRKCGFAQVIIGLSGGIDSALTAVLASRALGPDNVLGVALPSTISAPESEADARELAANLGIDFKVIPISAVVESFQTTLAPLFAGRPPDITEQNLQARARGNLLMALANKFNRLLLSTGNKSEMAVGYCTLYGDMSGGLAVIADVPKTMVYRLARHINQERPMIPARTLTRPPTAELAPGQRDDDDLPPYDLLDPILAAYLEENKSIAEIIAMGFDQAVVEDVVRRIRRNEYKRKQAAIGLKVTTKAFGHGRRYPICENYQEGGN